MADTTFAAELAAASAAGAVVDPVARAFPNTTRGAFSESSRAGVLTPTANYNQRCYMQVLTAEAPFTAVRVLLGNADTAGPVTVGPVGVASTGTATDINPSSGALTQAFLGGAGTAVIPVTNNAARSNLLWTDWTAITPAPRLDGGALPILMVRADVPDTTTATLTDTYNYWESADAALGGRFVRARRDALGKALTPTNWASSAFFNGSIILGVEFRYSVPVVSIAAFGDSITAGSALDQTFFNQYQRAAFGLSTSSAPIVVQNYGHAGQTTAQFTQRAIDYLTAVDANGIYINSPFALICAVGSPNDGDITATVAASARLLVYRVMDICRQRGIVFMPASVTPRVNNGNTTSVNTNDAHRQALNAEFMALGGRGVIPIDVAGAIQSSGNAALYISTAYMKLNDGTHPSDLAAQKMADDAAKPAFRKLKPLAGQPA